MNPNGFSLQYIHANDVIRMVAKYGHGALMAKFDLKAAYCNIPAHQVISGYQLL